MAIHNVTNWLWRHVIVYLYGADVSGTPVNKCGGGYIYTCCVPFARTLGGGGDGSGVASRGIMSVRSDPMGNGGLSAGPTLRHIGGLFRDVPTPSILLHSPSSQQHHHLPPPSPAFRHLVPQLPQSHHQACKKEMLTILWDLQHLKINIY